MAKLKKNEVQLKALKDIEIKAKELKGLKAVIESAVSGFTATFAATDSASKQVKYTCEIKEKEFKAFLESKGKALGAEINALSTKHEIELDEEERSLCEFFAKKAEKKKEESV